MQLFFMVGKYSDSIIIISTFLGVRSEFKRLRPLWVPVFVEFCYTSVALPLLWSVFVVRSLFVCPALDPRRICSQWYFAPGSLYGEYTAKLSLSVYSCVQ